MYQIYKNNFQLKTNFRVSSIFQTFVLKYYPSLFLSSIDIRTFSAQLLSVELNFRSTGSQTAREKLCTSDNRFPLNLIRDHRFKTDSIVFSRGFDQRFIACANFDRGLYPTSTRGIYRARPPTVNSLSFLTMSRPTYGPASFNLQSVFALK